jgi:hypothetical protein
MMRRAKVAAVGFAVLVVAAASVVLFTTSALADRPTQVQHVLLISVDGMHQSDLDWYVAQHPGSELAKLATGGAGQ